MIPMLFSQHRHMACIAQCSHGTIFPSAATTNLDSRKFSSLDTTKNHKTCVWQLKRRASVSFHGRNWSWQSLSAISTPSLWWCYVWEIQVTGSIFLEIQVTTSMGLRELDLPFFLKICLILYLAFPKIHFSYMRTRIFLPTRLHLLNIYDFMGYLPSVPKISLL